MICSVIHTLSPVETSALQKSKDFIEPYCCHQFTYKYFSFLVKHDQALMGATSHICNTAI